MRLAAAGGRNVDDYGERVPPEPPGGGGDGPRRARSRERSPCPVTPLGACEGRYYLASTRGEVICHPFTQMVTRAGLSSLFDGDDTWLRLEFPRFGKAPTDATGNVVGEAPVIGFDPQEAGQYLMRECAALPVYDTQVALRGRGVWRGPGGGMIVHCGGALLIGPSTGSGSAGWTTRAPGARIEGAIYRAVPAIPPPLFPPAPPDLAYELRDALSGWSYVHDTGPHGVLGWIGQAMLGALPDWRAHILVVGGPGSGKSWLCDLVAGALGPLANTFNSYSEPGLRAALSTESRPVILDESEGDDDERGQVDKTVGLIRLMSSGSGMQGVRGAAGGGRVQGYAVTGSAYLSAINAPDLKPQDRSRITKVELRELAVDADEKAARAAIVRFRGASAALWGRMLHQAPVYRENFELIRSLIKAAGSSARQAEQPAALLSAYYALVEDAPVDATVVELELPLYAWMVQTVADDADETGPQLCLAHLYGMLVLAWRGGERITIGQLLAEARRVDGDSARRTLYAYGIRVDAPSSGHEVDGFWIANRNPQLLELFGGTQWAKYRWGDELKRLDGASAAPRPIWIGTAQSRATWLPASYLPPISGTVDKPP